MDLDLDTLYAEAVASLELAVKAEKELLATQSEIRGKLSEITADVTTAKGSLCLDPEVAVILDNIHSVAILMSKSVAGSWEWDKLSGEVVYYDSIGDVIGSASLEDTPDNSTYVKAGMPS